MKRRILAYMLIEMLALSLCCCGKSSEKKESDTELAFDTGSAEENKSGQTEDDKEDESGQTEENKSEQTEEVSSEEQESVPEDFSFEKLKNRKFYFSSGAGGWATILVIRPDGSFSGEYFDDDMGDSGEEYPNGTRYQSEFSGIFLQPVKVNDYTYSMQIQQLSYRQEPETEEIKDGVRYCYCEAYGLDEAENILLYLPDAPLAELPEEFKTWIGLNAASGADTDKLPFYALNNEAMQYGFSSSDMIEDAKQMLAAVEEQTSSLKNSIEQDPLTQTEYNEKTKELYELWDSALNSVWKSLKETKDAESMKAITEEEREWIASKEQEMQKAGAVCYDCQSKSGGNDERQGL